MLKTSFPHRFIAALILLAGVTHTVKANELGEHLYMRNCAACHGMDGEGLAGVAPPLEHAALWQTLGTSGARYIAGVVTSGLSGPLKVGGREYKMTMPPQSHLTSAELAAISNFVLKELNQDKDAMTVSAEMIDGMKKAPLSHPELHALRAQTQPLARR